MVLWAIILYQILLLVIRQRYAELYVFSPLWLEWSSKSLIPVSNLITAEFLQWPTCQNEVLALWNYIQAPPWHNFSFGFYSSLLCLTHDVLQLHDSFSWYLKYFPSYLLSSILPITKLNHELLQEAFNVFFSTYSCFQQNAILLWPHSSLHILLL